MSTATAPIEAKVTSATVGAALSGVVLWVFGTYVFPDTGIPGPVVALISLVVPALVTFIFGYMARHTPRTAADGTTRP